MNRTTAAEPAAPSIETRLAIYRTMVECRAFETRAQELFFEGLVRGTTHLGVGQEAVAAGFAAAMRPDDYTFATYRASVAQPVAEIGRYAPRRLHLCHLSGPQSCPGPRNPHGAAVWRALRPGEPPHGRAIAP